MIICKVLTRHFTKLLDDYGVPNTTTFPTIIGFREQQPNRYIRPYKIQKPQKPCGIEIRIHLLSDSIKLIVDNPVRFLSERVPDYPSFVKIAGDLALAQADYDEPDGIERITKFIKEELTAHYAPIDRSI